MAFFRIVSVFSDTIISVLSVSNKITFDPFGKGIHFDDSAVDYNPNDNTGNRIKHAIIKNPTLTDFDAVMSGGSNNIHLANSPEYDGVASNKQVSILLSNSYIEDLKINFNGWGGYNVNETTLIENNIFVRGTFGADNESNTLVKKNIFYNVNFSITSCHFEYNIFESCNISRFYAQSYYSGTEYTFKNNFINSNITKFQGGRYINFINNTYKINTGDYIISNYQLLDF